MTERTRIIIVVSGGVVQSVVSDVPVTYVVDDSDTEGQPGESLVSRPCPWGSEEPTQVLKSGLVSAQVAPEPVEAYFRAVESNG